MRVANAFLTHGLLFEGLNKIFKAVSTFLLVVHPLLSLESFNHPAYFVLIGILERVVLNLGHNEFLSDSKVFIPTVKFGDMLDQITRLHLDMRQVLSTEIRLRHFFTNFQINNLSPS